MQPCQPTVIKETRARNAHPAISPSNIRGRRVIISIGNINKRSVGLYEQSAKARPLSNWRSDMSRRSANARKKKPNAVVCPPPRHSTKNGINESATASDVDHALRGIEPRTGQSSLSAATNSPADIKSQER